MKYGYFQKCFEYLRLMDVLTRMGIQLELMYQINKRPLENLSIRP